jgi:hypothetical protein
MIKAKLNLFILCLLSPVLLSGKFAQAIAANNKVGGVIKPVAGIAIRAGNSVLTRGNVTKI